MKAFLKSVRIAPKKANLVAKMVRGMPVNDALSSLERTNKKAARILEKLIKSAADNARSNDNQNPHDLVVKSLVVNKAQAFHRGVPMARGRIRRMRKFLSHISVTLGIADIEDEPKAEKKAEKPAAKKAPAKKPTKAASQKAEKKVKSESSESKDAEPPKEDAPKKQASKASADSSSTNS